MHTMTQIRKKDMLGYVQTAAAAGAFRFSGQVVAQRSVFRPSIIMEMFWKVLNIIGLL